ncbi:hypothetical protein ABW20_dc0106720 [Dactylellina cionopaga]|nr:hypothetical protein ABW20_dc0106720 [Dactylellina cionopaga]
MELKNVCQDPNGASKLAYDIAAFHNNPEACEIFDDQGKPIGWFVREEEELSPRVFKGLLTKKDGKENLCVMKVFSPGWPRSKYDFILSFNMK